MVKCINGDGRKVAFQGAVLCGPCDLAEDIRIDQAERDFEEFLVRREGF